MELKTVCHQLDSKLIEYFSQLKQFYQEQAILEQYMKDGFLNLSRARYNMGVKAVGTSQFNENSMVALSTVSVDEMTSSFQLNHPSVSKSVKKFDDSKLRKRNIGKDTEIENIGTSTSKVIEQENYMPIDPIKWFGVLVPQNLRKCQADFKQAVETMVTIANIKQRLTSLQTEYRILLKKKTRIINNEETN